MDGRHPIAITTQTKYAVPSHVHCRATGRDREHKLREHYSAQRFTWNFDWRNVIFSDEVIVSNSNDSTALLYCMNAHRYDERFLSRINKSGCVRVACWGWMSYDGAGLLKRIHGRYMAEVYEHILANVMIPSARKRYPEGTLFFQQDNHPIHTANQIQRWFTRRGDVDPVDWPPNSPDMNPIQNLWAAVKRILRSNWAKQLPVRTPKELWDRVLDVWEEMAKNLDLFHNPVDPMPRRMRAIVDAGKMKYFVVGGYTWGIILNDGLGIIKGSEENVHLAVKINKECTRKAKLMESASGTGTRPQREKQNLEATSTRVTASSTRCGNCERDSTPGYNTSSALCDVWNLKGDTCYGQYHRRLAFKFSRANHTFPNGRSSVSYVAASPTHYLYITKSCIVASDN
ncbi:hypothetical protein ANN_10930 [Periplaneta americana]|uniref:Tc1-like transposase DDE domain-containing protein n=1 Tax=Periplaneta americana TaxID=6978 RepID=A0ABQ8T5B9_PERAM|nr:hypothetical protein ANN_10930 [Periplaneta americana]